MVWFPRPAWAAPDNARPPKLTRFSLHTPELSAPDTYRLDLDLDTADNGLVRAELMYHLQAEGGAVIRYSLVWEGAPLHTGTHTLHIPLAVGELPAGQYRLFAVILTDAAGNRAAYYTDQTGNMLEDYVSGHTLPCEGGLVVNGPVADTTPPVLLHFALPQAEFEAPGTLRFSLELVEEGTGVSEVLLLYQYFHPDQNVTSHRLVWQTQEPLYTGTHQLEVALGDTLPAGEYRLFAVQLTDGAGNARTYSRHSDSQLIDYYTDTTAEADTYLQLRAAVRDTAAPQLVALTQQNTLLNTTGRLQVLVEIHEEESGLAGMQLCYNYPGGDGLSRTLILEWAAETPLTSGEYLLEFALDGSVAPTRLNLVSASVWDAAGNQGVYAAENGQLVPPSGAPINYPARLHLSDAYPLAAWGDAGSAQLAGEVSTLARGQTAVVACPDEVTLDIALVRAAADSGAVLLCEQGDVQWALRPQQGGSIMLKSSAPTSVLSSNGEAALTLQLAAHNLPAGSVLRVYTGGYTPLWVTPVQNGAAAAEPQAVQTKPDGYHEIPLPAGDAEMTLLLSVQRPDYTSPPGTGTGCAQTNGGKAPADGTVPATGDNAAGHLTALLCSASACAALVRYRRRKIK